VQRQLGLAGGLKAKIEIIPDRTAVNFCDTVTGMQIDLFAYGPFAGLTLRF